MLTDIGSLADLTNIGTLFAFVLVSGGVLTLPKVTNLRGESTGGKFRLPYINGKFIVPLPAVVLDNLKPSGLSALDTNVVVTEILDSARQSAASGKTIHPK